ncbi:retrovirus-related pol polyprotein from transposon TNT 1-94 [Tanacetum coccineum]
MSRTIPPPLVTNSGMLETLTGGGSHIRKRGPYVTKSPASTSEYILIKPQKQWSHDDSKLANQDKRLKTIIISCLPNDVMKYDIKYATAKSMWNDLILSHEGPYDTMDTKIASLRLKFNTFKALEGEKSETKRVTIQSSTPKALIFSSYTQDSDSDVKEDTKSINEFLADLNAEFHDRALLANQKRLYKRSGRVGSARKPMDKSNEICFASGKQGHFQKDCPSKKTSLPTYLSSNKTYNKPKLYLNSSSSQQHNQNADNNKKDNRGKYKALKAELALHTKKINALSKSKSENGLVAKSFDWDEESLSFEDKGVTIVKAFMAITEDEPVMGKANARSGENSPSETTSEVTSNTDSKCDNQEPLPPLSKLSGAERIGTSNNVTPLADLTMSPSVPTLSPNKKVDSSIEQLLLTFMLEVKGLEEHIKPSSNNSLSVSQTGISKYCRFNDDHSDEYSGCSRHMKRVKQYLHRYSKKSCPKVVLGDNSLGDTEGYDLVNCNGITFTRVAYVNALKHNLINISQLCDANFKVLFTKTQGTIFNRNNEVVLISPRRIDIYVIDMSSYNEESNTCLVSKESNSKDLAVVYMVGMVERASTQRGKTCSGVHLSSQRSKFGYGGNTNKMLYELQVERVRVMSKESLSCVGSRGGNIEEPMDGEEVALVDGVFDGAFGALSDEGCCCGEGVLSSS